MRKAYLFCIVLLAAVLCACGKKPANSDNGEVAPEKRDFAVLLSEEYDADIVLLNADGHEFRETLERREITVDAIDTLRADKAKSYGCILILDRKGTCPLTVEIVKKLVRFADENRYDIQYIGRAGVSLFREAGVRDAEENDVAVTYAPASTDPEQSGSNVILGLWNEGNEELAIRSEEAMEEEILSDLCYLAKIARDFRKSVK
ncbi:MAG: hypothetical protein J5532_10430 [Lachnospiraceae bacterium]|nr:hypothetical protein [Lachnospiraceae bacterium]